MWLLIRYSSDHRYLQNGNILAAKTFIKHYTATIPSSIKLESDSVIPVGDRDEVHMTKDMLVNFAQMAVLTCQRAQGEQNKVMRESWVRLCGTYGTKVSLLATPEMRAVCLLIVIRRRPFTYKIRSWTKLQPCISRSHHPEDRQPIPLAIWCLLYSEALRRVNLHDAC